MLASLVRALFASRAFGHDAFTLAAEVEVGVVEPVRLPIFIIETKESVTQAGIHAVHQLHATTTAPRRDEGILNILPCFLGAYSISYHASMGIE